jgi:hypothetical protein
VDGSLDSTFGVDGRVTSQFFSGFQAFAAALQPDGKIVVAGAVGPFVGLARFNSDGSLDDGWFFANLILESGDNATQRDKIKDLSASELALDLDWIAP